MQNKYVTIFPIHNKHQCIANYILKESNSDTLDAIKNEDIKILDVVWMKFFNLLICKGNAIRECILRKWCL